MLEIKGGFLRTIKIIDNLMGFQGFCFGRLTMRMFEVGF
jgi:hypothetical protein